MMMDNPDSVEFVDRVNLLTRYLKTMQMPMSEDERTALTTLCAQLVEMLEETDETACPMCGTTDGFHTDERCLETSVG